MIPIPALSTVIRFGSSGGPETPQNQEASVYAPLRPVAHLERLKSKYLTCLAMGIPVTY
jgi:hypothetical protein